MVNVALIGCGYWGSILKKYLVADVRFNLVSVLDSKSDLNSILQNDDIDSVVIATPEETHYVLSKLALMNNKNVFVEKPLAYTEKECLELKELAVKHEKALVVDYTWTFTPTVQHIHYLLLSGTIGKVHNMKFEHTRPFSSKNIHWLLTSQMLSILEWMTPLNKLAFEMISDSTIAFANEELHGKIVTHYGPTKYTNVVFQGTNGTIIYQPEVGYYLNDTLVESDESNTLQYVFDCFYSKLNKRPTYRLDSAISVTKVLEQLNVSVQ